MSKYYEQNHAHQGIGGDGSSQISYNSLTDLPDITVTTDSTLTGDGSTSSPLSVANPYYAPTTTEHQLASTQNITSGVDTVINFTGTNWSSGTYTVPSGGDGLYNLKSRCKCLTTSGAGTYRLTQVRINGTIKDYNRSDNMSNIGLDTNIHISLSAGDTIQYRFQQDSGSTLSLQSGVYTKCEFTRYTDDS